MCITRSQLTPAAHSRLIGIAFVLAAITLWSTVPFGTRLLMRNGGVFSWAFLTVTRLSFAAVVLLVARVIHERRAGQPLFVKMHRWGWLGIAALGLVLNLVFYAIGLRFTTASATSVITDINPIVTVLLAALLLGERLTVNKVAGMVVTFCGVAVAILHGINVNDLTSSKHLLGNLIEVGAATVWPLYAIGQTKLLQDTGNRQALVPIFGLAAVTMVCVLPFTGPVILATPTPIEWGVLIFLGAGATAAAYWLFAAGLQRLQTSEGSMFSVLMPPLSLLMAWAFLGEQPHAGVLYGLIFVITGLVLILWHRNHSPVRVRRKEHRHAHQLQ